MNLEGGTPNTPAAAGAETEMDRWRLVELGHQAAVVVHQLRQPLFALKGLIQLARQAPGSAPAHLALAESQLLLLEELVNGWSDFSRRSSVITERFDVRASVESALVLLRHRGQASGVEVVADLGPGLMVVGSMLELQQAIVNLGQNAVEAMEGRPGSRLVVRVDGGTVVIEDNGPGLPSEVQDRLFQPYVTTKARGTGLGLSIARALVEHAGGRLELSTGSGGVVWRIVLAAAA